MTPTELWNTYLRRHPQAREALVSAYHFGTVKEEANAAVTRVCLGEKTGCVSFPQRFEHDQTPCPEPGDYAVITDFAGNGICLIRTVRVEECTVEEAWERFRRLDTVREAKEEWIAARRAGQQEMCEKLGLEWSAGLPVLVEEFEVVFKVKRVKVRCS